MTPIKLLRRLFYWLADTLLYQPRARRALRGCELAPDVLVQGELKLSAQGRIRIGSKVLFRRGIAPQELWCGPGAEILIGDRVSFNYGNLVRATQAVRIGANCMIGSFARLDDSAEGFETLGPIIVEDDVWIAHGAVIAPGVRIGRGSVVAAGSTVLRDVPADTLAMGDPARCFPLTLLAGDDDKPA